MKKNDTKNSNQPKLGSQVFSEATLFGQPMVQTTEGKEVHDLNDLSKSLVNSLMVNEKNIKTMLQERIKSFNLNRLGKTNDKSNGNNFDEIDRKGQ